MTPTKKVVGATSGQVIRQNFHNFLAEIGLDVDDWVLRTKCMADIGELVEGKASKEDLSFMHNGATINLALLSLPSLINEVIHHMPHRVFIHKSILER